MEKPARCRRPDIIVACILDTFSFECLRYEASFYQLRRDTWKEQIQQRRPHFLFVESAWSGVDDTWRNVFIHKRNPFKKELFALLNFCKENNIKTVFWNKEDPLYYSNFLETAKLFDDVFTTDENCRAKYMKDLGHRRVYPLPFAAQPKIHNPVNSSYHDKENVAFAGTWYGKLLERQEDIRLILDPAKEFGLHIYDRMNSFADNHDYKFPAEYQPYIVGELEYKEMLKAYKSYKVFLNVNSVKNSPTMFSRRVFEILASGTNVISSYALGIEKLLGDIVPMSRTQGETARLLHRLLNDSEYSQRLSLRGLRAVHAEHLYQHRFKAILESIGIEDPIDPIPSITVIVCPDKDQGVEGVLEMYRNQRWDNKELLIIRHCHNLALEKAEGDYLAFFNKDAYYAPNFLTDIINAFNYTDADIIGKGCYFACAEDKKELVVRNTMQENRFVSSLAPASAVYKREVFSKLKFPQTNTPDQEFLAHCTAQGLKVYAADKYNFLIRTKVQFNPVTDRLIGMANNYKGDCKAWVTV